MKRKIVAIIHGDINSLRNAWRPADGVSVEESDGRLEVVFPEGRLDDFALLEAEVNRLSPTREIDLVPFFRCSDYTRDDLLSAELLWMQPLNSPGINWNGASPVVTQRCPICERNRSVIRTDVEPVASATAEPSHAILGCEGLVLLDDRLLKGLRGLGYDRGLRSLPVGIETPDRGRIDRYALAFSEVDLGPPVAGMRYGAPCPACGRPEIVANRAFRQSFNRASWDGSDFCSSRFHDAGFLMVSRRAWGLLEEMTTTPLEDVFLDPVDLV